MIPTRIIEDLQNERVYQVTRGREGKIEGESGWSYEFDDSNTVSDWTRYIVNYLGKAGGTTKVEPENYRKNMIKVAALAIAAVEAFDRNGSMPKNHWEV